MFFNRVNGKCQMKSIFKFVILPASLTLVTFFPAFAKTTPQTNVAVGNSDSMSWWLGYAVQQAETITDNDCRDEIRGHLARVQALAGDVDGSIASASAISRLNKRIYVYTFAAKTFYKQGNMSGYKKSIEQAKSAALSDMSIESRIFMNSNVVRAYLDCNDVDGAKSYAESITDHRQTQQAYKKIAAYLASNNDIENSNAIVDNITNESGKESALVEIAETCIREASLPVAKQMVKRITRPDFKDRVYEKLGAAFAEKGNIEQAQAVAEKISNPMHKSSVIAAIAKYQINSGDIDLGKKTAQKLTHRDHKIAVYTLIAEKQADAGEIDSAVATIETMVKMIDDSPLAADKSKFGTFDDSFKKGTVETVYLRVAKNLAGKGDMEGCNKYIAKAIAGVKEINDVPIWKGTVFIKIVEAQLETGDIQGAQKTAKEITEEHNLSWGLYNIVKAQLEKGDIAGAIVTYQEIADTMNKSFACGQIASAFVKKTKIAEAKKMLSTLGNSSREALAYRGTARVFVEMGHTEELANWLDKISTPQAKVCACIGAVDEIMKLGKSRPGEN